MATGTDITIAISIRAMPCGSAKSHYFVYSEYQYKTLDVAAALAIIQQFIIYDCK